MRQFIAYMMSEIDMAQRRLFDDDAPYTEQQVPPTVPFTESELGYIDQHQQQASHVALGYPEGYPQVQVPVNPGLHSDWYYNVPGNGLDRNQWVENALNYNDEAAHTSVSTFDNVQLNSSNITFEPTLQGSTHADAALINGTIQTEPLHRTSIRSKSLQEPVPHSPHDTEPFSSVRSPNVSRSKSDNTGQQSVLQQRSPTNAADELSAPVAVVIPVVQKKAPTKKQNRLQPEDDDDELAAPSDSKSNKSKSREASRSKSNKQEQAINEPSGANEEVEPNVPQAAPDETKPSEDTPHNTNPDEEVQLIQLDHPTNQPSEPSKAETHFTESTKPPRKEPKKKKLKRGKTTSVTIKKTYEPDVEDDVIWVDERPSNIDLQHHDRPNSIPTPDSIPTPATEQETIAVVEIPNPAPSSVTGGDQGDPNPAPKKRGRKRKKTSEQPPAIPEEPSIGNNGHAPVQNPSNVSVVVDKPANDLASNHTNEHPPNPSNNPSTIDEAQSHPAPPEPQPELEKEPTSNAPETPKKSTPNHNISNHQDQGQSGEETSTETPNRPNNDSNRGPTKHSPIPGTSKVPYRVGLSRRARIAPLLKVIRK